MNQDFQNQENFEEINLMDYVNVIIKRKKIIIAMFLGAAVAAGIFSFLMPKIYKIDTVLEIGTFGGTQIENSIQLAEKIKVENYKIIIMEKLDIAEKDYPKLKVDNPSNTNLIIRKIESSDSQEAKLILEEGNRLILEEHQKKLDELKIKTEEEIKETQKRLTALESQKIYADQGIADLQISILSLKEKLNFSTPSKIIKPPTISERPISPNIILNIIIASILGLFAGIFLAFLKEWWDKNKNLTNNN